MVVPRAGGVPDDVRMKQLSMVDDLPLSALAEAGTSHPLNKLHRHKLLRFPHFHELHCRASLAAAKLSD